MYVRTVNSCLLSILQILDTAGTTKAAGKVGGGQGAADKTSQHPKWSSAEGAERAIRSSSGDAAVHTVGERRRCFQIPDSLDFDRFGTRDHVAPLLAPAQALFCTRRAAPPGSKNRKKCRKLCLYIFNILSMERELWGIFIYEKITISSNLTRGSRKEWNLGN